MAMAATPAHADDGDPAVLFRKGRSDAYQHGQTADAIRYWEALYTRSGRSGGLPPSPSTSLAPTPSSATPRNRRRTTRRSSPRWPPSGKRTRPSNPTVTKEEGEARVELEALKAKKRPAAPPRRDATGGRQRRRRGSAGVRLHRVRHAGRASRRVRAGHGDGEHAGGHRAGRTGARHRGRRPPPAAPVEVPKTAPAPSPPPLATHIERPFSPIVLYVAGGAAVVSSLVPILTYEHASTPCRAARSRSGRAATTPPASATTTPLAAHRLRDARRAARARRGLCRSRRLVPPRHAPRREAPPPLPADLACSPSSRPSRPSPAKDAAAPSDSPVHFDKYGQLSWYLRR